MSEESSVPPKRPRRQRRRRRRFGIWMLLSIAFMIGLLGLAGMSVTGKTLNAPAWLTGQLVARVNSSFTNGHITLGRLALEVNERGVPHMLLRDVGIYDSRGVEVARLNEMGAGLSIASMLQGQFKPDVLQLNGAQVSMLRRADGKFDVSFGAENGATGTLPDLLDKIEQIFLTSPLTEADLVEAGDLTITVEDARSGRFWRVTGGRLQIQQEANDLDYSIAFDVFNGTEELAEVVLGIRSDKRDSSASFGATFKNAAAADIALQSPVLSFLGILDAPISGAVRAEFDPAGALEGLAGSLEIETGALRPTAETKPVGFETGKAYFQYNPELEQIRFSELTFVSEAGRATGSGVAYLRDFANNWPSTMLGQFSLSELEVEASPVFAAPVSFSEGAIEFRMRLAPFHVDIGQFVLGSGDDKLFASGSVRAGKLGWETSVDAKLGRISKERLLGLWPMIFAKKSRDWVSKNVIQGQVQNVVAAVRIRPDTTPRAGLSFEFADATVRYHRTMPLMTNASGYASFHDFALNVALESGSVESAVGGRIDVAGTTYRIEDARINPPRARADLRGKSSITAVLSVLNEPPLSILKNTTQSVDFADGNVAFNGHLNFEARRGLQLKDIDYEVMGEITDFSTQALVKGHTMSGQRISLTAVPEKVEISGPIQIGTASLDVTWLQDNDPAKVGQSQVEGTLDLSQGLIDEFRIGLPAGSVSGRGVGQLSIALNAGQAPVLKLETDLKGVGLNVAAVGWSKAPSSSGKFEFGGTFGAVPSVDRLEFSAPGLSATGGRVAFTDSAQMRETSFQRVKLGGWLDAPVKLTSRGKGRAPAISLERGTIDIRKTTLGTSSGQGGPVNLSLDQLVVAEGLKLTNLTANLDGTKGFVGDFSGRVNGGAMVAGQIVTSKNGPAVRIQSKNAGRVLRDSGIFKNGVDGSMDLTLRPRPQSGVYAGKLDVSNIRIIDAPALTELLSAISVVGLLDQLNGPGIAFSQVDADFRLSPKAVTLTRSSATGPSLGVSLEGNYDLATKRMDMQGVLSPVYFLNSIGQIFSRRGEGVFGFVFRIRGLADSPQVSVNPLSILTPGMFREIFRQTPPAN